MPNFWKFFINIVTWAETAGSEKEQTSFEPAGQRKNYSVQLFSNFMKGTVL